MIPPLGSLPIVTPLPLLTYFCYKLDNTSLSSGAPVSIVERSSVETMLEIEKVSSRDGALGEADPSSARGVDVDIVFSQSMSRLVRADV